MPIDTLNIMTICKADNWVYDRLPRFVAMINANAGTKTTKHLLLLIEEDKIAADERNYMVEKLNEHFDQVVVAAYEDPYPIYHLLYFDKLRSALLTVFGLSEGLYMDPDIDVVRDISALRHVAPQADLMWVANPVPVIQVVRDLRKCGFTRQDAECGEPVLMEAGFIYMRRNFLEDFENFQAQFKNLDPFMPGSTYWNMIQQSLGKHAYRLPDDYNRTFWDVEGCASIARTVHYTGQWKHLQPYVEYANNHINIYPKKVSFPECRIPRYERPQVP